MKSLIAAFTFFTRLPIWRIATVDKRYYRDIVVFWPFTGWLTGGIMCLVLWGMSHIVSPLTAVVAALLSRTLITGSLHEDGLADFMDGIGGGHTRERVLSIMKDSHIGTYGVISLIFYFLLATSLLSSLPVTTACCVIFAADSWSKASAAQLINMLPYARTEQQAKSKTAYNKMTWRQFLILIIAGALPLIYLPVSLLPAAIFPIITILAIVSLLRRRIGGYTGDCCGAAFLLCELSFYLGCSILYRLLS